MAMTLDEIKRHLQEHLSDGLILIIGSGLSCAEGLPGMGELTKHLSANLSQHLSASDQKLWEEIESLLGEGLEAALLKKATTETLEAAIVSMTGALIAEREQQVIADVFAGKRKLRLTSLIDHVLKPSSSLPIITTNYDRLVEIAVEEAGLGVDTMFIGRFFGSFNEKESRMSFCRGAVSKRAKTFLEYRKRAIVCKPHGSLDWYMRNGTPISYAGELNNNIPRLIIAPGGNKFRTGYESPFDLHRGKANNLIDQASRFLIIGYGFNDDHLETHLKPAIESGKPTHMLAHKLTPNARALSMEFPNITALEYGDENGVEGTRFTFDKKQQFIPGLGIWDVNQFITEVFEP